MPVFYQAPVAAMRDAVQRAAVTGVFLTAATTLGRPAAGGWRHLSAVPGGAPFSHPLRTAAQAAAAKREDFRTVSAALTDLTPAMLDQALRLLQADTLDMSERFIAPVRWLRGLRRELQGAPRLRDNRLWRAIASAPEGYCHPRGSVVGSLLQDIAEGRPFAEVKLRWNAKVHPLHYQRPQAAPSAGNIADAERIIARLGIADSLHRRFARLDEVEALWRPRPADMGPAPDGVFAHIRPKARVAALSLPPVVMTWDKFARTVLPAAEAIEARIPGDPGPYMALTTAGHADAPPILRWDEAGRRNPVSLYVYPDGSPAAQWRLQVGAWHRVTAVTAFPNLWRPKPRPYLGEGAVLLLEGAMDTRTHTGAGLFPSFLREELAPVRATIEAYSRQADVGGRAEGSACGLFLTRRGQLHAALRVALDGQVMECLIDRWD